MGETIDFQEKRKEFLRQNKVDIEVPTFMQKQNREVYRASRKERERVQRHNSKLRRKAVAKRLATIGLVGLIAFGGYKGYQSYQEKNESITLEQALENGESLDTLKIDNSIKNELDSIKEELTGNNITNQELLQLSTKINNLQFDTLKTKLSKTLNVDESDITLHTGVVSNQTGETHESVQVQDGQTYVGKEIFNNTNTISYDISRYIKDIGEMQTMMGKMQTGDIDRNSIIKSYKSTIKEIEQMATSKMFVDDKGNISIQKLQKRDLEKEDNKIAKQDRQVDDEMEK